MSELEDRLNAVLSDPGEMERLTRMAQQLMGGAPSPEPNGSEAPDKAEETLPAGLNAALGKVLGGAKGKGKPPLLQAVGPYLDEGRRRRLERALRLASTARVAGTALQKMGGFDGL